MSIVEILKNDIKEIVKKKYGVKVDSSAFDLAAPPENQPGHFGSNIAMFLAKPMKKAPFIIGEEIAQELRKLEYITAVEIIKPGYTNISLNLSFYKNELDKLLKSDSAFKNNFGKGKTVNIEFVSANPVGPLNIVSGRAAAYGDTLANIFDYSGYKTVRETYVNDFGRQMHLFALSLMARYLQLYGRTNQVPEEGYQGEYVTEIAKAMKEIKGEAFYKTIGNVEKLEDCLQYPEFRAFGLKHVLDWQKQTLERFGVKFDEWFSETTLHEKGEVDEAFKLIEKRGLFYEKEDAVWFKTTEFGDDKDRVVKKTDGGYTYFASDIAYIQNKVKRGADLVINILGPDHHGYVKRLESIMQGLGYEKERIRVIILQQVNLLEGGEKMKMSKRAGNFVSLDELLESVGRDAARYFFIMRSYSSHLDFDLELAKEQSDKNPVYYLQYAYARLCNIFEKAKEVVKDSSEYDADKIAFETLEKEELELIRAILCIPEFIKESAERESPNWLVQHVHFLASHFHSFYGKLRVVQDDKQIMAKRLFILNALKRTFEVCFGIIGITPRTKM
ncbi:MAG: arginine--tRNA ligase [bacterium]